MQQEIRETLRGKAEDLTFVSELSYDTRRCDSDVMCTMTVNKGIFDMVADPKNLVPGKMYSKSYFAPHMIHQRTMLELTNSRHEQRWAQDGRSLDMMTGSIKKRFAMIPHQTSRLSSGAMRVVTQCLMELK